ncbi:unnamed protein product [Urochloa humidicola]
MPGETDTETETETETDTDTEEKGFSNFTIGHVNRNRPPQPEAAHPQAPPVARCAEYPSYTNTTAPHSYPPHPAYADPPCPTWKPLAYGYHQPQPGWGSADYPHSDYPAPSPEKPSYVYGFGGGCSGYPCSPTQGPRPGDNWGQNNGYGGHMACLGAGVGVAAYGIFKHFRTRRRRNRYGYTRPGGHHRNDRHCTGPSPENWDPEQNAEKKS